MEICIKVLFMNSKKYCLIILLSRIYFWFESYDRFNYSAPPWTTLLMISNIICCLILLIIDFFVVLTGCHVDSFNGKTISFVILYLGSLVVVPTLLTIILESNDKKIRKKMEKHAGEKYLNLLWKKSRSRSFIMEWFLYSSLLLVPTIVNGLSISYLCD